MIVSIITDGISKPARKAVQKWAETEKLLFEKVIRELMIKKEKDQNVALNVRSL